MPLSNSQKQKLHELELNRGGVAFVQQRSIAKPNPTIILSLGGLGGKTINMLKGKFKSEIGECDHIYFRMIDTDKKDTDQLCRIMSNGEVNPLSGAYMETQECINLYDPQIHKLLLDENIPQHISDWLNPALKGTLLDNNGAKQRRQIGRAMYSADVVYNNVRDRLTTVINDAISKANSTNEDIDVIVIAGISGGTGSGTIIDIPYLVHDIFRSLGYDNYHIAGYIYTPDAQFNEQGIKGNESILLNLKRNGYAALKEIDLFMNSEETETNYNLNLSVGNINIRKNIFSTCTLVSGYSQSGGINDLSLTIGRLTDQLMDMLTNITFIDDTGNPVQLAKSLMSNEDAMLSSFFTNHKDRKIYHRYATYKYQVLGYTSIRIPRDEILAYCVNKIYEKVIEEFNDYQKLDKHKMDQVFKATNIQNKASVREFAKQLKQKIETFTSLPDPITKKMIKKDPLVAYDMACEIAEEEAKKCSLPSYKSELSDALYEALKYQVEIISDDFGPYMAIEAITHKPSKTTVGNPDEPFNGIIQQLVDLTNEFDTDANTAINSERKGKRKLQELAEGASSGIFTDHDAIDEYVARSCQLACITRINTVLFPAISEALKDVARRLNDYNNEIFYVYTSILDEISRILNEDGQYLTKGVQTQHDGINYYQLDVLQSGEGKKERLENYLNDFISKVDVDLLAQNFIKEMRVNRDRWIAANNNEDFVVVDEVRTLMDECLEKNNLKDEIIEKFVTVAYSPKNITPDELNAMWDDNSPDGLKMQALSSAAREIYTLLKNESRTLAQTTSIALNASNFTGTVYVGTLKDAPQLSALINRMVEEDGRKPATSTAKNKFIMTTQYINVPMYILQGMAEYNEVYVKNDTNGKHMDENKQNWAQFPNPYTIDSVAKDIKAKNRHFDELKNYPDYNILVDIKNKVDYAIDELGSIILEDKITGGKSLYLLRIDHKPADQAKFNNDLKEALKANHDLDYIEFMQSNGYSITKVIVTSDPVDVDMTKRDFNNLSAEDMEKYADVPVPIADLYKWIRKSPNYMNIVNNNNPLFDEVYQLVKETKEGFKDAKRYIENVEIFAHALMSGMVRMKNDNVLIWTYMDGNNPITVNLLAMKKFDKKYYLYHVFTKFNELSSRRLEEYKVKSLRKVNDADLVDYSVISAHVEEILSDDLLGDLFNADIINEEAQEQGVMDNYTVTDIDGDEGNAFKVLREFYKKLDSSLS